MEAKERIKKAYEYLRNNGMAHTQQDVADIMGVKKENISRAFNGNMKYLTPNFIGRFNNAFGGIFNTEWLIEEQGEMLINPKQEKSNSKYSDIEGKAIPLLPVSAQGGRLNDFIVSVRESECERVVSPIKEADFAIPISGDSMAPEYPNGSQVHVKKINEKAFIEWGRVYVLDTCNGTVIKRITPSEKEGYIKCLSINPDPIYAPFEVCLNDVYGIYRVMLCLSIK